MARFTFFRRLSSRLPSRSSSPAPSARSPLKLSCSSAAESPIAGADAIETATATTPVPADADAAAAPAVRHVSGSTASSTTSPGCSASPDDEVTESDLSTAPSSALPSPHPPATSGASNKPDLRPTESGDVIHTANESQRVDEHTRERFPLEPASLCLPLPDSVPDDVDSEPSSPPFESPTLPNLPQRSSSLAWSAHGKLSSNIVHRHARSRSSPSPSPPNPASGPETQDRSITSTQGSHRRHTLGQTAAASAHAPLASDEHVLKLVPNRGPTLALTRAAPANSGFAPPLPALEESPDPTPLPRRAAMPRKIWVKRPHASAATLVQIQDNDLVDDFKDMVLRKYANSLGRTFDAPDMIIRIITRPDRHGNRQDRMLNPEEDMCRAIDTYYPNGQTVDEALIIEAAQIRTPRPSPHTRTHLYPNGMHEELTRPSEESTTYFPNMQPAVGPNGVPTPGAALVNHPYTVAPDVPRAKAMSVINSGVLPTLHSPSIPRKPKDGRPWPVRTHTSSPTVLTHPPHSNTGLAPQPISSHSNQPLGALPHRPLPSSPAPEPPPALTSPPGPHSESAKNASSPPTPSSSTSRHPPGRSGRKKSAKFPPGMQERPFADTWNAGSALPSMSSILDTSMPPINVLIVEDNMISMNVLVRLMRKLGVRWSTAANGRIAVDKWREGGFHLVLMDIQMPVMNGLQATKEIRRLERVNGIGVFSATRLASTDQGADDDSGRPREPATHDPDADKLPVGNGLFKSPIILVALTASSLQSDRHEALAAGCNDFLTKPVDHLWMERKVKEWGCMQALIDFDGWRQWKEIAAKLEAEKAGDQKIKNQEREEKLRLKAEKKNRESLPSREKEAKAKRQSREGQVADSAALDGAPSPAAPPEDAFSPSRSSTAPVAV